jgi:hypothetical protein
VVLIEHLEAARAPTNSALVRSQARTLGIAVIEP